MKKKAGGIGGALTRKFGPLPAWAWAVVAFGGLWYYRSKQSMASGTGTGSVGPAPATPQAQTTLQPGESVYDPNTGALSTAPGSAGDGGGSGTTDISTAIEDLARAMLDGRGGGGGTSSAGKTHKPRKVPKLKGKGAIRAPRGHAKPTTPKGYKARGLGHGFWEFVPKADGGKRTSKPKNQHGKPTTTTKPPKSGTQTKPRSTSSVKHTNGGRTAPRASKPATTVKANRQAQPNATASRVRSNQQTASLVSAPVVRQRPVASHTTTKASSQPSVHRTASTPARTVRAPTPPPARKTVVKKGR